LIEKIEKYEPIDLMNYWIKSSDKDYDDILDLKEKNINVFCIRSYQYWNKGDVNLNTYK